MSSGDVEVIRLDRDGVQHPGHERLAACPTAVIGQLDTHGKLRDGDRGNGRTLAQGPYSLPTGATQGLRLKLTKAGRKMIVARLHRKGRRNLRALLSFADSGRNAFTLTRPLHLSGGR
jgi:hypothetical protein